MTENFGRGGGGRGGVVVVGLLHALLYSGLCASALVPACMMRRQ